MKRIKQVKFSRYPGAVIIELAHSVNELSLQELREFNAVDNDKVRMNLGNSMSESSALDFVERNGLELLN